MCVLCRPVVSRAGAHAHAVIDAHSSIKIITSNAAATTCSRLSQKKEIAYIEHVLKLKIHHKLDIEQFRNKAHEKAKVWCAAAVHARPAVHAP